MTLLPSTFSSLLVQDLSVRHYIFKHEVQKHYDTVQAITFSVYNTTFSPQLKCDISIQHRICNIYTVIIIVIILIIIIII